jgi:hypothetical protein
MMQPMPMSPLHSPKEFGGAAVQWACTRRGRMLVLTVVFFAMVLGYGGMHNREVSNKTVVSVKGKEGCYAAAGTQWVCYFMC